MASPLAKSLPRVAFSNKPTRGRKNKEANKNVTRKSPGSKGTGDVVSDDEDGQTGDQDGDSSTLGANKRDEDSSDALALSGTASTGSSATARLAGLDSDDVFDDDVFNAAHSAQHIDGKLDDNDDDDNDYTAVGNVSESEESVVDDEEDNLLRMAERDLIEEFERTEKPRNTTIVAGRMNQMKLDDNKFLARRLSVQSEDSLHEVEVDLDMSEDPFRGLSSNDDLYKEMIEDAEVAFDDELTRWRMPEGARRSRENSVQLASHSKKVRFESTPSRSSSMSSDDDPRDAYPDLFDDLEDPPILRTRVNSSNGAELDAQDSESVYDFDFEDEYDLDKTAWHAEDESDSDSTSRSDSDDDDEDDGDTTDEETVDEQLARMRQMQMAKGKPTEHICVSAPGTPASTTERKTHGSARRAGANSRLVTPKSGKKTPRAGTFVHDPTRATVSADVRGSGVKLVCPTNPPEQDRAYWERARAALSSRDGSPRQSWTRTTPKAASIPQRPLTAKSTLGTLFDGNLDFLRNHDVAGIAGDLLHHSSNGLARTSFTSTTLTGDDDNGFGNEGNVNMADFVQLEDSDSDMMMLDDTAGMSADSGMSSVGHHDFYSDYSGLMSSPSTPQRRDSAGGGGPTLLDHLDQQRGLVSSFRTNQHRARHISSLASHPAQRAQASELNALQAGRRSAANTPMTPARKARASRDLGATPSAAGVRKYSITASASGSPMAAASSARRRRSRGSSLSGMHQTLALDRFASNASST